MKGIVCAVGMALFLVWGYASAGQVKIKDLADFDGVRGNDLVGYGIVVGLDGTGDSIRNSPFTEEMLSGLLERLGVNVTEDSLRSKNVAAVIVTATLPEFSRSGSKIDAGVSAIGDAKSLLGGTLVMTPLKAADGNIYAVAQGSVLAGGISIAGDAARVSEGVPTAGKIPLGARVEREVEFDFSAIADIRIALRNADFTTAVRIEHAINEYFRKVVAVAHDSGTVTVDIRRIEGLAPAHILSQVENIRIDPESRARVVMDHRTGTIVIRSQVRISPVAVSQGGLILRVSEAKYISQPNPFSEGRTVALPMTYADLSQKEGMGFAEIGGEPTLREMIEGLNALGLMPREIMDVVKSIHVAGALHADLVIE